MQLTVFLAPAHRAAWTRRASGTAPSSPIRSAVQITTPIEPALRRLGHLLDQQHNERARQRTQAVMETRCCSLCTADHPGRDRRYLRYGARTNGGGTAAGACPAFRADTRRRSRGPACDDKLRGKGSACRLVIATGIWRRRAASQADISSTRDNEDYLAGSRTRLRLAAGTVSPAIYRRRSTPDTTWSKRGPADHPAATHYRDAAQRMLVNAGAPMSGQTLVAEWRPTIEGVTITARAVTFRRPAAVSSSSG
jgi:hypothetical protein